MGEVILIVLRFIQLYVLRFSVRYIFYVTDIKKNPVISRLWFKRIRNVPDVTCERIAWATRNLKFVREIRASSRRSMRQIRAPSNLRMLEQLLRASFAASSASSRLPHDCSRSMRRVAPLRSAPFCLASEYSRRVRACERSPQADGTVDVATHGVAATGAERRAVSLRLPRVATSSLPRSIGDRVSHSVLCTRSNTGRPTTSRRVDAKQS